MNDQSISLMKQIEFMNNTNCWQHKTTPIPILTHQFSASYQLNKQLAWSDTVVILCVRVRLYGTTPFIIRFPMNRHIINSHFFLFFLFSCFPPSLTHSHKLETLIDSLRLRYLFIWKSNNWFVFRCPVHIATLLSPSLCILVHPFGDLSKKKKVHNNWPENYCSLFLIKIKIKSKKW